MGEDQPVSFSLCAAFVALVSAGTLTNVYLFRLYGTKSGSEMPGPRRGWAQSWEFPASSLGDFLHAMDFLRYSYLQSGQEAKAREVIEHTNHVVGANKESKADHHALFAAWTALEFVASLRRFLSGPAAAFFFQGIGSPPGERAFPCISASIENRTPPNGGFLRELCWLLSLLESTLLGYLTSVHSKGLTDLLSLLQSTLTKNRGRGG